MASRRPFSRSSSRNRRDQVDDEKSTQVAAEESAKARGNLRPETTQREDGLLADRLRDREQPYEKGADEKGADEKGADEKEADETPTAEKETYEDDPYEPPTREDDPYETPTAEKETYEDDPDEPPTPLDEPDGKGSDGAGRGTRSPVDETYDVGRVDPDDLDTADPDPTPPPSSSGGSSYDAEHEYMIRRSVGAPDDFDADEWMSTDAGWLHVPSAQMYESPGGMPSGDPVGPMPLTYAMIEQARILTPDGATGVPHSGHGGTSQYSGLTSELGGGGPATQYDPETKAYLDDDGHIVGYHQSVADDIGPLIELPGGELLIADPVNGRFVDHTGSPVEPDYVNHDEGQFLRTTVSLEGLDETELTRLLGSAGAAGIEQASGGVTGLHTGGYEITDPAIGMLIAEGAVDNLALDLATGQIIYDPMASHVEDLMSGEPGGIGAAETQEHEYRAQAGAPTEFEPSDWMPTDDGWLHVPSARMYDSPGSAPDLDQLDPIPLNGAMLDHARPLTTTGADGTVRFPSEDHRADAMTSGLAGGAGATHYDPATKAYLDAEGHVVGYHDTVSDAIGPLVVMPDGTRLMVDTENHRFLDETGTPIEPEYMQEPGPVQTHVSLEGLSESDVRALLASSGADGITHYEGGLASVQGGGYEVTDPTLAAMLEMGNYDNLAVDVHTGAIVIDPMAPPVDDFLKHRHGDIGANDIDEQQMAVAAGRPEDFDIEEWMTTEAGWLHVPTANLYDHPGGAPEMDWQPEPLPLTQAMIEQARVLTAEGATGEPRTGGTDSLHTGELTSEIGSGEPAAYYDPETKAYLDADGHVVGYHQSVADEIGPLVALPDGSYVMVDEANRRYLDHEGSAHRHESQLEGEGIAPIPTTVRLEDLSPEELSTLLGSAGAEGTEAHEGLMGVQQGGAYEITDPTLQALIDEGDLQGLAVDLTTGEIVVDPYAEPVTEFVSHLESVETTSYDFDDLDDDMEDASTEDTGTDQTVEADPYDTDDTDTDDTDTDTDDTDSGADDTSDADADADVGDTAAAMDTGSPLETGEESTAASIAGRTDPMTAEALDTEFGAGVRAPDAAGLDQPDSMESAVEFGGGTEMPEVAPSPASATEPMEPMEPMVAEMADDPFEADPVSAPEPAPEPEPEPIVVEDPGMDAEPEIDDFG